MHGLIIEQGLLLMVVGMSITFCFLYLLVWVMRGIAKVVPRFNHLMPDPEVKVVKPKAAGGVQNDEVNVAIAVAVAAVRGK